VAATHKRNAVLLQYPYNTISVTSQHLPQYFTHTSATWKTQTRHFSLRSQP